MISQRTRGLQSTLLVCQGVLIVFALCLAMRVAFAYFAEASSLHLDHYPTYAAILVAGLFFESVTRNPDRLAASLFRRNYLECHAISVRQTIVSAGALFLYLAAAKDAFVSRTVLALAMPLLYFVLFLSNSFLPRLLVRLLFENSRPERILLIGPSLGARRLLPWLKAKDAFGFSTVGLLTEQEGGGLPGVPRLGGWDDLEEILGRHQVSQVIFLTLPASTSLHERMVELIESFGARILILSDLEERLHHRIVHLEDDGVSFIAPRLEPLEHPFNRFAKRSLDIAISAPVVLLLLPLLAGVVWILQRLQSPGPVFFRQVRAGIQNREFRILKFRTMSVARPDESARPGADGHRVFPAGRWLRRLSLDEIPQFVNVLLGEMSVCGPRPHLLQHNEDFARKMTRYRLRAFVKPGVTGLAQVRGFRGDVCCVEDIEHRFESDISYIENWRLLLDLAIVFRTALQIVLFAADEVLRYFRPSAVPAVEVAQGVVPAGAFEPATRAYLPEATRRSFRTILGVRFFTGSTAEAVSLGLEGGLVVAPSAPVLLGLEKDSAQAAAVCGSALAITDSGFMVLLWKLLTGEEITRISGLAYLKLLLEQPVMKAAGATFWVMPSLESARRTIAWLATRGICITEDDCYIAPQYGPRQGWIADSELVRQVQERRPQQIVMAVGGGVQEKLGAELLRHLDYLPAVHCTGGAIGFMTGEQASIPMWADQCMLGWAYRCLHQPARFVPRYWEARKLLSLMLRYHGRLPGAERFASSLDLRDGGRSSRSRSALSILTPAGSSAPCP